MKALGAFTHELKLYYAPYHYVTYHAKVLGVVVVAGLALGESRQQNQTAQK